MTSLVVLRAVSHCQVIHRWPHIAAFPRCRSSAVSWMTSLICTAKYLSFGTQTIFPVVCRYFSKEVSREYCKALSMTQNAHTTIDYNKSRANERKASYVLITQLHESSWWSQGQGFSHAHAHEGKGISFSVSVLVLMCFWRAHGLSEF